MGARSRARRRQSEPANDTRGGIWSLDLISSGISETDTPNDTAPETLLYTTESQYGGYAGRIRVSWEDTPLVIFVISVVTSTWHGQSSTPG